MDQIEDSLRTRDIFAATAIATKGGSLTKIEWVNETAFLEFTPASHCRHVERDYYAGRLNVSALAYVETFRDLKRRIFDARREIGRLEINSGKLRP